ncbi:jg12313, partial [Pararge aegeria aegeria]
DLLDLFIDDMQPFSIVEDKGFQKLLSWIPGYIPPSRKTISNSLIPALHEKILNECRDILNTEAVTACITTDCWTSNNNDSFIAVTAHYISPKFKFKSILLECKGCPGSHTSDHLAQQIKGIILEWNLLNKVNFAVSDNAHNVCNAIITQLKWKHYGCFAHSLNLIVKEAVIPIQVTIEKVKKIVAHFKRSTQATEKLMKYQSNHLGMEQPKKLIMDVATRWNSTYLMVKRFMELSEAVKATTAVINRDWPIVTEEEWTNLELLVSVLAPFEEITSTLSGQNYVTGGLAIVLSNSLQDICQEMLQNRRYIDAEVIQNVLLKLKWGLDTRFQNIEQSKSLALCTLLDPRFKLEMFKSDTNKNAIKEHCHELMAGILSRQVPILNTVQVAPNATVSG